MAEHIRALVVILAIAIVVFAYLKKSLGNTLGMETFTRWRNAWFAITIIAFAAHNFWLFMLLAAAYLVYVKGKETDVLGLYLALMIILPTLNNRIPMLIDISYIRLMTIILLVPMVLKLMKNPDVPGLGRTWADKFLIAFLILNTILMMRGTTPTDAIRYGLVATLDIFVPYFVASRAILNMKHLTNVLNGFLMSAMVVAVIGMFEHVTGWLLYNSLQSALNTESGFGKYLGRGDDLRALGSLDHSLILGFVLMVAVGLFAYLSKSFPNRFTKIIGFMILIGGLYATLSRSPWMGAAIALVIFLVISPKAPKNIAILAIVAIVAIPILPALPFGQKVMNMLPFVGKTDTYNIEYREVLIDKSILLIKKNPVFGAYDVTKDPDMEEMVQGEGIVDIVNTYLGVVLATGLVGLFLFLGPLVFALFTLLLTLTRIRDSSSSAMTCGRSLHGVYIAILVTIFATSSIGIIATLYWTVIGLIFSFARVALLPEIDEQGAMRKVAAVDYPSFRLGKAV